MDTYSPTISSSITGPLLSPNHTFLLEVSPHGLTLIKLRLKSTIIHAMNNQLPFFYSKHFEKLLEEPVENLKEKYSTDFIQRKEDVEWKESSNWGPTLKLNTDKGWIKLKTGNPELEKLKSLLQHWI